MKFIATAVLILILAGIAIFSVSIVSANSEVGTIDSTNRYAWSENVGWIDFGSTQGNAHVSDIALSGFAWGENIGWIVLNCANTSSCATVDYKVTNDSAGTLGGYAWSENAGWISFAPTGGGVTIDSAGTFSGYAWGENIGWIVFNCSTTNSCATGDYKVTTEWRPASIRNAASSSGNTTIPGASYPQGPPGSTVYLPGYTLPSTPPPTQPGNPPVPDEAKLYKLPSSSTVYVVRDSLLRPIINEAAFIAAGFQWYTIQIVTTLPNYPIGPLFTEASVRLRAGMLVQGPHQELYFFSEGTLRPFKNAATFKILGYNPALVHSLSGAELELYTIGQTITETSTHPNGTLIKYADSVKVYVLEAGKKRWIMNETIFKRNRWTFAEVITMKTAETYPTGTTIQ